MPDLYDKLGAPPQNGMEPLDITVIGGRNTPQRGGDLYDRLGVAPKREIGTGEAISRAAGSIGPAFRRAGAAVAYGPAQLADYASSLFGAEPGLAESVINSIAPDQRTIDANAIQSTETAGAFGEAIIPMGETFGTLASDMAGGFGLRTAARPLISAASEAARHGPGVANAIRAIAPELKAGASVGVPSGMRRTEERQQELTGAGVSPMMAAPQAALAGGGQVLQFALPAGMPATARSLTGRIAQRSAAGGAVGAGSASGQAAIENQFAPESLQISPTDPKVLIPATILGALMGNTSGRARRPQFRSGADVEALRGQLGYPDAESRAILEDPDSFVGSREIPAADPVQAFVERMTGSRGPGEPVIDVPPEDMPSARTADLKAKDQARKTSRADARAAFEPILGRESEVYPQLAPDAPNSMEARARQALDAVGETPESTANAFERSRANPRTNASTRQPLRQPPTQRSLDVAGRPTLAEAARPDTIAVSKAGEAFPLDDSGTPLDPGAVRGRMMAEGTKAQTETGARRAFDVAEAERARKQGAQDAANVRQPTGEIDAAQARDLRDVSAGGTASREGTAATTPQRFSYFRPKIENGQMTGGQRVTVMGEPQRMLGADGKVKDAVMVRFEDHPNKPEFLVPADEIKSFERPASPRFEQDIVGGRTAGRSAGPMLDAQGRPVVDKQGITRTRPADVRTEGGIYSPPRGAGTGEQQPQPRRAAQRATTEPSPEIIPAARPTPPARTGQTIEGVFTPEPAGTEVARTVRHESVDDAKADPDFDIGFSEDVTLTKADVADIRSAFDDAKAEADSGTNRVSPAREDSQPAPEARAPEAPTGRPNEQGSDSGIRQSGGEAQRIGAPKERTNDTSGRVERDKVSDIGAARRAGKEFQEANDDAIQLLKEVKELYKAGKIPLDDLEPVLAKLQGSKDPINDIGLLSELLEKHESRASNDSVNKRSVAEIFDEVDQKTHASQRANESETDGGRPPDDVLKGAKKSPGGGTLYSNPFPEAISALARAVKAVFARTSNPQAVELGVATRELWESIRDSTISVSEKIARSVGHFYWSDASVMRSVAEARDLPVLKKIADMFTDSGAKGAIGETYEAEVTSHHRRGVNAVRDAIESVIDNPAAMAMVRKLVENRSAIKGDTPVARAARKIAKLLDDEYARMKDAGVDVKERKDYFPRVWDEATIAKRKASFLRAAAKGYEIDGMSRADAMQAAENWHKATRFGADAVPEVPFAHLSSEAPAANFTKPRELSNRAVRESGLAEFVEQDWIASLEMYLRRTAKRTAFERRFGGKTKDGKPWAKWREMQDEIDASGNTDLATWAQQRVIAMSGQLGTSTTQFVRTGTSLVKALTVAMFLKRAIISSQTEPIQAYNRAASMGHGRAIAAMAKMYTQGYGDLSDAMGITRRSLKREDQYAIARTLGTIINDMVDAQMIAMRLDGPAMHDTKGTPVQRFADKIAGSAVRASGLHQWTIGNRVNATIVATDFIKAMTDDLGGNRKALAQYELDRLGISASDAPGFAAYMKKNPEAAQIAADATKGNKAARQYLTAAGRFTDQIIMDPKAADKPYLAKHPVASLMYGLQSWMYSYWYNVQKANINQIRTALTKGGGFSAKDRASMMIAPIASSAATFVFVDQALNAMRDLFSGKEKNEEFRAKQNEQSIFGVSVRTLRSLSQAQILGLFDPVVNTAVGARYSKEPGSGIAGPIAGRAGAAVAATVGMASDKNTESSNTQERKFAGAMYDLTVDPALSLLAARVPLGMASSFLSQRDELRQSWNKMWAGESRAKVKEDARRKSGQPTAFERRQQRKESGKMSAAERRSAGLE